MSARADADLRRRTETEEGSRQPAQHRASLACRQGDRRRRRDAQSDHRSPGESKPLQTLRVSRPDSTPDSRRFVVTPISLRGCISGENFGE